MRPQWPAVFAEGYAPWSERAVRCYVQEACRVVGCSAELSIRELPSMGVYEFQHGPNPEHVKVLPKSVIDADRLPAARLVVEGGLWVARVHWDDMVAAGWRTGTREKAFFD